MAQLRFLHQVPPSVVTYSSAISACEKALEWEAALGLMSQMPASKVAQRKKLRPPDQFVFASWASKVTANQVTYNSAPWLGELKSFVETEAGRATSQAISACDKGSQWRQAAALLQKMREVHILQASLAW